MFLPQPLTPSRTDGFTLKADDIFADNDVNYDIVGIKGFTVKAGTDSSSSQYYKVAVTPSAEATAAQRYGSSGLSDQLTITPTNIRPQTAVFVYLSVQAQAYEKDAQIKSVIPGSDYYIDLVFKISNTRPVFGTKAGFDGEEHVEVAVGGTYTLNITDFLKDPDGTIPRFVTEKESVEGKTYDFIKLPEYEYVSVTRENTLLSLPSGTNYNVGAVQTAGTLTKDSGEGTVKTGFIEKGGDNSYDYSYIMASASDSSAAHPWFTYSYAPDGSSITFAGKAASQYIYDDKNSNYEGRLGHFYILVRVYDPGDTGDYGIWYPIAITVTATTPGETPTPSGFELEFHGYTAGDKNKDATFTAKDEDSVILTPISYMDESGVVHGVGNTNPGSVVNDAPNAKPFLYDADAFSYGVETDAQRDKPWTHKLNDIVTLNLNYNPDGSLSYPTDSVHITKIINVDTDRYVNYDISQFFKIELVELYAANTVFGNLLPSQLNAMGITATSSTVYKFYGLKLTPLRSTGNYFYEFGVSVVDSHRAINEGVHVYAKVQNRSVNIRRESTGGTDYPFNTSIWKGEHVNNGAVVIQEYVKYTIQSGKTLILTPYDFAYDFDSVDDGTSTSAVKLGRAGNPNTNPDNGDAYTEAYNAITKQYNVYRTDNLSDPSRLKNVDVTVEPLTFTNMSAFGASMQAYSSYLTSSVRSSGGILGWDNESAIQTIQISGISRTQKALLTLGFTVTDGFTVVEYNIAVTVENAAPELAASVKDEISKNGGAYKFSTVANTGAGLYDEKWFTADVNSDPTNGVGWDIDGDTVRFVAGSVRIVAYDESQKSNSVTGGYYDALTADFKGVSSTEGTAVYKLSDYLSAVLTLNSAGVSAIRVTALSSTQIFPLPIYLEFRCRDGSIGDEQYATLHIPVEVYNVKPEFVTDNLTPISGNQYWMVKNEVDAEKALPRYIVNSQELYDSSVIVATPANKMLLFKDADAQQLPLLNPAKILSDGNNKLEALVTKATNRTSITKDNAQDVFGDYAAIAYTQTYGTSTDSGQDDSWLDVELLCFEKVGGSFQPITEGSLSKIDNCKYWAIKIVDTRIGNDNVKDTQIAIRFKDDHHGVTIYDYQNGERVTTTGDSEGLVLSLYYQYQTAGVTIMHEYYRTNGNIESQSKLRDGRDDLSTDYTVDVDYLFGYQLGLDTDLPTGTTQASLANAKFYYEDSRTNFTNQYFVIGTNTDDAQSTLTPKLYPNVKSNAFYYGPIKLAGAGAPTYMPLSYIAMLQNSTSTGTSASTKHVTFANEISVLSKLGDYLQWGNGVNYKNYENWSESSAIYQLFKNVSLTDGINVWRGDVSPKAANYILNNSYVDIEYHTDTTVNTTQDGYPDYDRNDFSLYINSFRGQSTKGVSKYEFSRVKTTFYEDTLGFVFTKKNNSPRITSTLKFSVDVMTTDDKSATQVAWTELYMDNSKPTITGLSGPDSGKQSSTNLEYSVAYNLFMTTGDTLGKKVTFIKQDTNQQDKLYISYKDDDRDDEMVFLVPSITDKKLSESNLTASEIASINGSSLITYNSYADYFGLDSNGIQLPDDQKNEYIPNPGYSQFFTVEPDDHSSTMITIIPKAKTELDFTGIDSPDEQAAYLKANNLVKDSFGIYYPLRVLFYDRVKDQTGFEQGWIGCIVIRVYITNNELKFNSSAVGASAGNTYSVGLTKGSPFSVDVSTFLTDYDIERVNMSLVTKDDPAYANLPSNPSSKLVKDNQKLVKDYLIMPVSSGTQLTYTNATPTSNFSGKAVSELPVEAVLDGSTAIKFTATGAFKASTDNPIMLQFRFNESGGGRELVMTFAIRYYNESPSANSATYGNSSTLNIIMKTHDSFKLYAFDASAGFASDEKGGFRSPSYFAAKSGYPPTSASDMKTAFKLFTSAADYERQFPTPGNELGSLILGDDDAPSTIRFMPNNTSSRIQVGSFASPSDEFNFKVDVDESLKLTNENNDNLAYPTAVTVTADAVTTNAVFTVELYDSYEGVKTSVTLNITVLSTPPTVRPVFESDKMNKLEKVDQLADQPVTDTFKLNLKFGETFAFNLEELMTDHDGERDISGFHVPESFDGNAKFRITNGGGVSSVSVAETEVDTVHGVRITATDYIPVSEAYAIIEMRVADTHGTNSGIVTILVYIEPQSITGDKTHSVTLKSREQFVSDGVVDSVDIVSSSTTGKLVIDPDANAPSAMYTVNVHARLISDGNGGYNQAGNDFTPSNDNKIVSRTQAAGGNGANTSTSNNAIAQYVSKFFTVGISDNGKTLEFTPNTSTRVAIPLYITVAKKYDNGGNGTMSPVVAYLNVSVQNSKPVAVENNDKNMGYPKRKVKDGDTEMEVIRTGEQFLTFRGTAGESLTWDIYNSSDENLGLFTDYDMSGVNGTTEVLSFVSSDYAALYKGSNPVLDVTSRSGQVTIKINHKVYPNEPPVTGAEDTSTLIRVSVTVEDNSKAQGVTYIDVYVENDVPEFKTVTEADGKGYTISDNGGDYVMYATIATNEKLRVNMRDIIDDADINIDQYVPCTPPSSNALTLETKSIVGTSGETLFDFRLEAGNTSSTNGTSEGISTYTYMEFTGISKNRGERVECLLQIRDTVSTAKTSVMRVILTVGNTKPEPKSDNMTITVQGVKLGEKVEKASFVDNIINYVTDINPKDMADATKEDNTSKTYVYIDTFRLPSIDSEIDTPTIFGPGYEENKKKVEEEREEGIDEMAGTARIATVCTVDYDDYDVCQTFGITVYPGVYGTQIVYFRVIDSGYIDGNATDGIPVEIPVTVTVVRPIDPDELQSFKIADKVTRLVTPELLLNTEAEPHNADGYVITDIKASGALSVSNQANGAGSSSAVNASAETKDWYLTANAKDPNAKITVTFDVGGKSVTLDFQVEVTDNNRPVLKLYEGKALFNVADLDMNNMIRISPEDWFEDPDIGDTMRFVSPLKVKITAYAQADLDAPNNQIILTFKGRGETEFTLHITDATGILYEHKVIIGCNDIAELSWFNSIVARIQSNPILFWIILGISLFLIILLIIILVVVHKKRKMRAEIEALLNSEAELEEEMLRLSGGGMVGGMNAFGLLGGGAQQPMNNPSLMIGSAATNPTPNTLQLGAGSGQTTGVSSTDAAQPQQGQPNPQTQQVPPQQPQPGQPYPHTQQVPPQQPQPGQPYPHTQQVPPQRPQPGQPYPHTQQVPPQRPQPGQVPPQQPYQRPMQPGQVPPQQSPYQRPMQPGQVPPQQPQQPVTPPKDGFDPDSF
ncbi:MAG: hypothetical protein J1G04_05635 [Clostridiales bacterium]|nr:hypothetical protein [Clostridiales bacterium]